MGEEFGNDFQSLFPEEPEELKTAVGTQEQLLRAHLGNERFDAIVKYSDLSAQASLDTDHAVANRLNAIASFYAALAGSLPVMALIAIAWSIFFWVIWALH